MSPPDAEAEPQCQEHEPDHHGEGVVEDVAGLQFHDLGRGPTDGFRSPVDGPVDHCDVDALPEQTADRVDRRKLLMITQTLECLVAGSLALASFYDVQSEQLIFFAAL